MHSLYECQILFLPSVIGVSKRGVTETEYMHLYGYKLARKVTLFNISGVDENEDGGT